MARNKYDVDESLETPFDITNFKRCGKYIKHSSKLLIIGTILGQIGSFVPGKIGVYMVYVASIAKSLMGAGIGVGVASKYKATPLVAVSAAVAGLIGAFPTAFAEGALALGNPGNPLSSFIAAYVAIEIGILISGKTPIDIILTPLLSGFIIDKSSFGYLTLFPYAFAFCNIACT